MKRSQWNEGKKSTDIKWYGKYPFPEIGSIWTPQELWPDEKYRWKVVSIDEQFGDIWYQLGGMEPHKNTIEYFIGNYRPYE